MKRLCILLLPLFASAACNQNIEAVNTGERLEDSPPPVARPEDSMTTLAEPAGMAAEMGGDEVPPFVKAYFMHTWVEALYSVPANRNPNPDWSSPLIDPVDGRVWCTDCHVSGQVDFARIPKQRVPLVDRYENDREFMADLMRKWVARLNSDDYFARAKLKEQVTCLTCHETNPAPEPVGD